MASATRPRAGGLVQSIQKFDWWLFTAAGVLIVVGLMSLYSIDHSIGSSYFRNQLVKFGIGVIPFAIFYFVNPEQWRRLRWVLYGATVALLGLVLAMGETKGGAQRWLQVGPIEVQPSELAKLLILITLASFYSYRQRETQRPTTFLLGFVHVALPMALIYKQPHLGSTLVMMCMFLAVSLVAGVPARNVIAAIVLGLSTLTAMYFIPGAMDPYQKERIDGLLKSHAPGPSMAERQLGTGKARSSPPEDHKLSTGYQVDRALIAFGAGGVGGEGFLHGEQKGGAFVPEQESDFIFTVMGEEGGLLGCTLTLLTFGLLFGRLWWIMYRAQRPYHQMLLAGIFTIFVSHTFANLGMIMGLLPVVGLWLPLMSLGGSALWLCMSMIALALRVKATEDEGEMFEGAGARSWAT